MGRQWAFSSFFVGPLMVLSVFLAFSGCDSGEKAVDEVTGNRAVKQYHQAKKEISKISDQQKERFKEIQEQEEDTKPDEQR